MYMIHCCEYDDQKREILAPCFLGLYIHYRVSGGKVNRSDCEVQGTMRCILGVMLYYPAAFLVQRCQKWHL